jgi:mRNA-degrading endonuclease RelE of RelBE toxin-antitoxin system
MLKIDISKSCAKDIKKFPAKIQKQIALKILELSKDPNANDVSQLKGHAPYKRATSGEYRIVFYVNKVSDPSSCYDG